MTYSQKVKKCKGIVDAINGLNDSESVHVMYSGKAYKVSAHDYGNCEKWFSISEYGRSSYSSMNISVMGKTSFTAYSFDMMSQKTTYKFSMLEMRLAKQADLDQVDKFLNP